MIDSHAHVVFGRSERLGAHSFTTHDSAEDFLAHLDGQPAIRWRRVGTHSIFKRP
jgi:hypothetical protein